MVDVRFELTTTDPCPAVDAIREVNQSVRLKGKKVISTNRLPNISLITLDVQAHCFFIGFYGPKALVFLLGFSMHLILKQLWDRGLRRNSSWHSRVCSVG